jgi:hypothetical protein
MFCNSSNDLVNLLRSTTQSGVESAVVDIRSENNHSLTFLKLILHNKLITGRIQNH